MAKDIAQLNTEDRVDEQSEESRDELDGQRVMSGLNRTHSKASDEDSDLVISNSVWRCVNVGRSRGRMVITTL